MRHTVRINTQMGEIVMYRIGIALEKNVVRAYLLDEAAAPSASSVEFSAGCGAAPGVKGPLPAESCAEFSAGCGECVVKAVAGIAKTVMEKAGITAGSVASVGIAVPGKVDRAAGVVICSDVLPMKDFPLAEKAAAAIGVRKVVIDSVINAEALAEAFFGSGDAAMLILLDIGKTVRSGIIIDRAPFTGFTGLGAELGHMVIVCDGYECGCGRRGCFEAYATDAGAAKLYREFGGEKDVTLSGLIAAAAQDKAAAAAKDRYIELTASAITDIINLFQPEELVLRGLLEENRDSLYDPIMEIVLRDQYTRHSPNKTKVRFAAVADAALKGAALIGR